MPRPLQLFVSCEHASNRIPNAYQQLFAGREAVLETHRGYDIGMLSFAEALAAAFNCPLISGDVSRLLIDLNRSRNSRSLFSEFTRSLPANQREELMRRFHHPYWSAARDIVAGIIATNRRVLHLSVHSFTPVLHDKVRNADIGLLYDPSRPDEKHWCLQWQQALATLMPSLRIRRNYPYRGNADSLVTALRKHFTAADYLGLELEINQKIPLENRLAWKTLQEQIGVSLHGIYPFSRHLT